MKRLQVCLTLLPLAVPCLSGCSGRASADEQALDLFFGQAKGARIEICSVYETNVIPSDKVAAYLAALSATNRTSVRFGWRSQVTASIVVVQASNDVWISYFGDEGIFQYGAFSFRLKSSLPTP